MAKKTISSFRIDERTLNNMKAAISKYNEKNIFRVSESEFMRLAIELLSQFILRDIALPIKITK